MKIIKETLFNNFIKKINEDNKPLIYIIEKSHKFKAIEKWNLEYIINNCKFNKFPFNYTFLPNIQEYFKFGIFNISLKNLGDYLIHEKKPIQYLNHIDKSSQVILNLDNNYFQPLVKDIYTKEKIQTLIGNEKRISNTNILIRKNINQFNYTTMIERSNCDIIYFHLGGRTKFYIFNPNDYENLESFLNYSLYDIRFSYIYYRKRDIKLSTVILNNNEILYIPKGWLCYQESLDKTNILIKMEIKYNKFYKNINLKNNIISIIPFFNEFKYLIIMMKIIYIYFIIFIKYILNKIF